MNTIDWSKAPEDATHFLPEQSALGWVKCFYKNIDGVWYARNAWDCDWYPDNDYVEIFEPLLIDRPKQWSGPQDGLPPAGTVCEYDSRPAGKGDQLWVTVKVNYLSEWTIVFQCIAVLEGAKQENIGVELSEMADASTARRFRPIRTPEQIAAEERDKGIDAILDAYTYTIGPCTHKLTHSQAMRLYDAGIRKVTL